MLSAGLTFLNLCLPNKIVVNNSALFVNFSGKHFQSGCYISSSWETLTLESHNRPPSQLTENYKTIEGFLFCFVLYMMGSTVCRVSEEIPVTHIQKTLQGEINLFKALYRTVSEIHSPLKDNS